MFAARETHVAGNGKRTSDAGGASTKLSERRNLCPAQAHQHVWQRLQPCRSRRQTGCILNLREEIVMSEKEAFDRTVKDDDFDLLVSFDRGNGVVELRNRVRPKDVKRGTINRYTPVVG